jgi:hypothetical protein
MKQTIITYGTFRMDEVLPYVTDTPTRREYKGYTEEVFPINMSALRYHVYKKQPVCHCCGIKGRFFLLQRLPQYMDMDAYFNLYGIERNEMVLLEREMIDPNAGETPDNFRTICQLCKNIKGDRTKIEMPNDVILRGRAIQSVRTIEDAIRWGNFWRAMKLNDEEFMLKWVDHAMGLHTDNTQKSMNKMLERIKKNAI